MSAMSPESNSSISGLTPASRMLRHAPYVGGSVDDDLTARIHCVEIERADFRF
jgi:hypothetical protein